MDTDDYEQLHVDANALGPAAQYLKEGDHAVLPVYDSQVLGVDLPAAVELTVADTEPGVQVDRVLGGPQAGDPRDRPRHPGPPVRRAGRSGEG